MDAAMESRPAGMFPAFLAGLEAGMLGALWMLVWMGLSSTWQRRSFWAPENLMATAFDRNASIRGSFAGTTFSGLALYLLIYSLLGAVFATAVRERLPWVRIALLSMVFGMAWYYLSFQVIFKSVMPLVALLHVERSTVLGHLVYGAVLGRYPVYLRRLEAARPKVIAVENPVAEEPAAEIPQAPPTG
ncbi:MAG TPA: hypothetical protein VLY04_01320 [Bryobacteraceae bacterium]|nr:hypothetical protein [Bryobacteraceae bacterium]